MIKLQNITKKFNGITVLDRITFEIFPNEVHALCGENGAGKSTLMKILAGIWSYPAYEGQILKQGNNGNEELRFRDIHDAQEVGIAIVHQELALVQEMTVLDNLFMGKELGFFGIQNKKEQIRIAGEHFRSIDFLPSHTTIVKELNIGWQQRLEIARALLAKPSVLVLDEPTSALPKDDSENLLKWIRKLADNGTACIYISHRMDEVFKIADKITVLRDGKSIWTKPIKKTNPDDVVSAMVARPPASMYSHTPHEPGELLYAVKDVNVIKNNRPILQVNDLKVHCGEIVGLAGMMGSGRSCLLQTLMGAVNNSHVTGSFKSDKEKTWKALPSKPYHAKKQGLFLIPEDRKLQALFMDENLIINLTNATISKYLKNNSLNKPAMEKACRDKMKQFSVKALSPNSIIRTLSGGNQQKMLLGRAAEVSPELLLLDEPTRGIDIATKELIYRQMENWTKQGWGIIWSSSELQELLGISDRIYTLANGSITGEFHKRPFDENTIMSYCARSQYNA